MSPWSVRITHHLFDWAVPASLRRDADIYRRAKRVALLDVSFLFWSAVFAAVYLALGSPLCSLITLTYTLWIMASLQVLRRGGSPTTATNLLCTGGCFTLLADAAFSGGSLSPPLLWLGCAPVVAVITLGVAWGAFWLAATLLMIAAVIACEALGLVPPNGLTAVQVGMLYYAVVFGSVICQFAMVWVGIGIEQRARDALRESNHQLSQARKCLESLQQGFGFSLEEWTKLKREKQALEYALACRGNRDDKKIDAELDAIEARLAKIDKLHGGGKKQGGA
jgi:hypothetical protein